VAARYAAVLFDLLTGLLDSWSLWDAVAGDQETGRRWRTAYLRRTYAAGRYRPYPEVVAEAARDQDLNPDLADQLVARWDEVRPWPETAAVLTELAGSVLLGVVTNCSEELGRRAAERVGVRFDVVVTAERAGAYKPRPEPYHLAVEELAAPPAAVLFVAGSPNDLVGAGAAGMPVWWHNRVRLDRGAAPPPIAEHDSLRPLPAAVLG
jgi:2-haloalkanoic acid dehalogenase type II